MYFIEIEDNKWLELNKEKLEVYNFNGGYHNITESDLATKKIIECDNWHVLYEKTRYCPLEVNIRYPDVWISPEGRFYDGDAHDNRAEEILEVVYGESDVCWPGDKLEELGWIRATRTLMWEVRFNDLERKTLTQKQYDVLWDWCVHHNKKFPKDIDVK